MLDDDVDVFDDEAFDDEAFDDDDNALCTQAWLLTGLTRSIPGILESANGRFALTTEEGRVFDVPLSEVTGVKFPWYYFGGGVKFHIGVNRYRLSFVKPTGYSGEIGDIGEGRRAGKVWKSALCLQTDS